MGKNGLLPKQTACHLLEDTLEVLYGGAAGGGKSEFLLQFAGRYTDLYPTKALLIRRTFKDLAQPGGLMARSHEWWKNTDAAWDGNTYTWRFPSGASVSFGYLEHDGDELRYQGGEYHLIGFDELTQIREHQYLYLFSRLRRLKGFPVKPAMRGATNPGGPGHEWVRKRFNLPSGPPYPDNINRKFVFALLDDNIYLDQDEYLESLRRLSDTGSDVTFEQLRHGNWMAMGSGGYFHPENFIIVGWGDVPPARTFRNILRYWDFGATERTDLTPNPDYTVGLKLGITHTVPGRLPRIYIFGIERFRLGPGGIEARIKQTAKRDGSHLPQWLEQERGAAGKNFVWQFGQHHLPGYIVRGLYVSGDKLTRGRQAAARVDEHRVHLVDGPNFQGEYWIPDFLGECGAFPEGDHDDQVDAFSHGLRALEREELMATSGRARMVSDELEPYDGRYISPVLQPTSLLTPYGALGDRYAVPR